MFLRLIPKIFYADVNIGRDFFVRCLGFEVLYQDDSISVLGRDNAKVYLVQDAQLAALDRPELAIETDDIAAIHDEIQSRAPEVLHPNSSTVQLKPWGSREFAVLDPTTLCVVFRQW